MVESYKFRKVFVLCSYMVLITVSLLSFGRLELPWPYDSIISLTGVVLFVTSTLVAAKIHSMFPEKHDRPEDFHELITWGPYAYCRHPFYLALIINQFSMALMLLSWAGLLACTLLLAGWYTLIKMEERELVRYWKDKYVKYMRCVPMLIPRLKRRPCPSEQDG